MSDSLAGAIGKLEAAVERLAAVARHVGDERAARAEAEPAGVPPAEVAALSARLEATIARLRAALPDGGEMPEGDMPEGELPDGESLEGDLPEVGGPEAGGPESGGPESGGPEPGGLGAGVPGGRSAGAGLMVDGRDEASRAGAGGRGDGGAPGGLPSRAGEG